MDKLKQYQMIIDYINAKEVKQPVYEFFKIIIKNELQRDYSYPRYDWPNQIRLQILHNRTPDEYIDTFEDINDRGLRSSIQDEILSYYRGIENSTLEDLEKIQRIFLNQFSNYRDFYRNKYQNFIKMYTDDHYPDYTYNFEKYMHNDDYDLPDGDNEEDIDDLTSED